MMGRVQVLAVILALSSCGGSGSESTDTTAPPTDPHTGVHLTSTTGGVFIPTDSEPWASFDSALEEELGTALDLALTETGAPGLALAVADPTNRARWVKTVGMANLEHEVPWALHTPYPIASVSKVFTAVTILQLVEEGVLSLDDPLDSWVPSPWDGQGVTLEHLLQHSSGIASYNYVGSFDASQEYTPVELLAWAALHEPELQFPPGTAHQYSNTGYILLGLVAEAATAQGLDALFDERFFRPLGMSHSYLMVDHPADMVHGYRDDPWRDATDEQHPSAGWAAGGIISTPEDLVAFGAGLFGGDLVSADTLALMTTPLVIDGEEVGYGLGLFGGYDPEWGGNWGHTGGYSGQLAYLYYMERPDRVVVAMANQFGVDLDRVANAAWFEVLGLSYTE